MLRFTMTFTLTFLSIWAFSQGPFITVSSSGNDNIAGLYVYRLVDDQLELIEKSGAVQSTGYHNFHPNAPFLYAVGNNKVYALRIDENSGHLTLINEQDSKGGPCYVKVDESGRYVMVANYGGATIGVYPIGRDGGLLEMQQSIQHTGSSIDTSRQKEAHPHLITVSPGNKYALVPDLGQDRIMVYTFDEASGRLTENKFMGKALPGAGPRHLEFHPSLPFVYVVNELNSTVTSYRWDNTQGKMDQIATYPMLDDQFNEFSKAADIHLTSDGQFLYASNRGHNSIAAYRVMNDGTLNAIDRYSCGGDFPRNFFITPDNRFLLVANQRSNNMAQYAINQKTGVLTLIKDFSDIPGALCIKLHR
ncbi:MAG: lactonase family protein [Saprospiraceae bacterium]|nr:lactonase family protein [Saprospiraceae bacterium]